MRFVCRGGARSVGNQPGQLMSLAVAALALSNAPGCSGSGPRGNPGPGSGGGAGSATGGNGGNAGNGGMTETVAPTDPTFQDGTRLVAQTYSSSGSAPLFVGIYDRQEHVACEFRAATDGALRCLPARVLLTPDPEPATRWQEGTEVLGGATGLRLRQSRIASADGGWFPNWVNGELADDRYGKPCAPNTTREANGTGMGACLPGHAVLAGLYFADSTCTEQLAQMETAKGVTPLFIATPKREFYALGEKFSAPVFIQLSSTGPCQQFSTGAEPGLDYYRIGASLPEDAAAAIRIVPRGVGRLAVQTVEVEGAGLAHVRHHAMASPYKGDGPYYDRNLSMLCRPTWTVGGELRCVPDQALYVLEPALTNFADPECTQPVTYQNEPAAVVLRKDAASGREVVVEVRRVSAEYSKTGYTRENSSTRECHEYLKGAGYPLGEVIPIDSFAVVDAHLDGG
jgi:hypothetical protein